MRNFYDRVENYFSQHRWIKPVGLGVVFVIYMVILFRLLVLINPGVQKLAWFFNDSVPADSLVYSSDETLTGYIVKEEKLFRQLQQKKYRYTRIDPYLVVNTTDNTFKLYNKGRLIREGQCSTGSYTLLVTGDQRQWIFETPKGIFRVQGKTKYPVWKKPDWAFIEEGLDVPPDYSPERYEYGVLGDYALSIGNGYLIHGTLYKRLLGMPVTHGCIRLDDEDLEAVYNNLEIGSRVFIF